MAFEEKINSEYKDRLFKWIFRDRGDLLQLYNAVNNTDYGNPEDLEINTIEDVVYLKMKNDVSFLMKDILNLYEHQSTFSPNLPLRGFLYFADLYRKVIGNQRDIYSSRLIPLPFPQFVVFYNGKQNEPERQVLSMSDAYPEGCVKSEASLQCYATVLNINLGSNAQLMQKCTRLHEYAIFIAKVREYMHTGKSIEEAVDLAVEECIRDGILADILRSNREEVRNMLLTEYNEEAHIENERRIASEEALEKGREEGIIQGEQRGKIEALFDILSEYGALPEKLSERIRGEQDLSVLQSWIKTAAKSSSIEEFEEKARI